MFKLSVHLRFCGKMLILCFNGNTGNSKESYLALIIFHELCLGKCWKLMAKFSLLKNGNEHRFIQ